MGSGSLNDEKKMWWLHFFSLAISGGMANAQSRADDPSDQMGYIKLRQYFNLLKLKCQSATEKFL